MGEKQNQPFQLCFNTSLQYREQARRVYYGAVFRSQEGNSRLQGETCGSSLSAVCRKACYTSAHK